MDLSHWNLVDELTSTQAAKLIGGCDPNIEESLDPHATAKAKLVRQELVEAMQLAAVKVALFFDRPVNEQTDAIKLIDVKRKYLPASMLIERILNAIDSLSAIEKELDPTMRALMESEHMQYTRDRFHRLAEHIIDGRHANFSLRREVIHYWCREAKITSAYDFTRGDDFATYDAAWGLSDATEVPRQVHPRSEKNYLSLIAAMAVDRYGYDPEAKRSEIPADLAAMLRAQGGALTDEVIRGYLREGAGHLNAQKKR